LALGLVTLYHGASMLLLGEGIHSQTATEIKEACLAAVESLVASAAKNKFPNRQGGLSGRKVLPNEPDLP
jgi:hypothetical protein